MNIRFLSFFVVVVAFAGTPPQSARADDKSLRQFIDDEISAAWKANNLTPAPAASDAEFLRRIHVDVVGAIPSCDETTAFLADTDSDKRAKLVDRLLADERYAVAQSLYWDQVLFGRDPPGEDSTRKRDGFVKWLRAQFAANASYDKLVGAMLRAEGNSADDGAPLFLVQFRNKPEDATVAVTRLFLGMELQCARCHDHPSEAWTQVDFYGMAAFFARLTVTEAGKSGNLTKYVIGEKSTGDVLFTGPAKTQKPGMKGEPVKPKFLMGDALVEPELPKDFKEPKAEGSKPLPKPLFSRKEKLAEWVTSSANPYFAKAAANRIWSQMMGRGLVDPVDGFTPTSKASHPALLDELAKQFTAHQFDLKWLMREIASSKAYQLASAGDSMASTDAAAKWFERARVRPLSAEEFVASIRVATWVEQAKKQGAKIEGNSEYFTRYFGEPTNGRGVFQGSIDEHLFLNNSDDVRNFVRVRKGNLAERLATSEEPAGKRVELLFLSVLSRTPTEAEQARFATYLDVKAKEPRQERASQAIWVLLNTSEFRFNR